MLKRKKKKEEEEEEKRETPALTLTPRFTDTQFKRSFEIYMSVLNIIGENSEFLKQFPLAIDSIKLWIFLYITVFQITRVFRVF